MYSITLTMGDEKFVGKGKTAQEALDTLPQPKKILAKGTVTFEKDGLKKSIYVVPHQIKRLPMKVAKILLVRQFDYGLK